MRIEELKLDKKYKDIFPITKKELETIELLVLQDGEIYQPLFVWKGQGILVYGYQYWEILNAHPDIKHTIREMDFEDWQEAQVWAVEHYIAQPEVRLWQKLEVAIKCEDYWLLKANAKKAKGKRNDLHSPGERKSDTTEADVLIGQKVGCSKTYVFYFRSVYFSGKTCLIDQCREGNLSIKAAYERLKPKNSKKTPKSKPGPDTPVELEIDGSDIFDECEHNINVGKKNTSRMDSTPVDHNPIVEKITATDVPNGAIWITLHRKDGQMQVVKRSYDAVKGIICIKINNYNCKNVASDDELIILEADHINGGTTEVLRKDEREFDKVAS
ncbi:hypothetical protein KAR91_34005 [Candidatus Pacearchaeota archaeon]|nr:hypothetical protein [Candidatus Pacearchaeota archaeon]